MPAYYLHQKKQIGVGHRADQLQCHYPGRRSPKPYTLKESIAPALRTVAVLSISGDGPISKEHQMAWTILIIAGLFEIAWAVGLKYSAGFTRLWPSIATLAAMGLSIFLLGIAVRTLPLGTAYAVWTGIGTIGALVFGITLFGEPASLIRILCASMIAAGIVGLKLFAPN